MFLVGYEVIFQFFNMDAWRGKVLAPQVAFVEDDKDTERTMEHALRVLSSLMNELVLSRRHYKGLHLGNASKVDRVRARMDKQVLKDYFANAPTFGPTLFGRRYRIIKAVVYHHLLPHYSPPHL